MANTDKRIVVVTGASRGIGRAICLSMANRIRKFILTIMLQEMILQKLPLPAKRKILFVKKAELPQAAALMLPQHRMWMLFLRISLIKPEKLMFWLIMPVLPETACF